MDPALADRLCTVSLFADLDQDHLTSVAALVDEFEAEPGHPLTLAGLVGAGLFLIEEGEVTLCLPDREVVLGPGEILGELALLDDRSVHTSRAVTKTAVRGYCISRDAFEKLLHDEPRIAIPMLKVLAKRLVDNITHH
jgi:CRP/FNR family cyclic AMP-dependent transcriptional regulator